MATLGTAVQIERREPPRADPGSRLESTLAPSLSRNAVQFALAWFQFGLLVLVIQQFDFGWEGNLPDVAVLAWLGFAIHHWLPDRLRLPFFATLSLASIPVAVGLGLGTAVIVAGLLLIALCHAPWPFKARILLLLWAGGILLVLRPSPFGPLVVLLASMFMFRIIIYLYDLKHRSAPFSLARALAYFFMLPNACFPLFPTVDYKTFCASHDNGDLFAIYQRGLRWMLRGSVHLFLYRLLYLFVQADGMEVRDLAGVASFMATTYLLYLRVSGSFHLIVGMLHLFGFNLPETHHLYLLSSSFLDLWRRINIYWKDFIQKVFFNPAYFRLRRFGATWALVLATLYAFFFTWMLHSYQMAWLRGTFALTWQDAVFWWTLAGLVLVNALWEMKRGRKRALGQAQRTWRSELGRALRTIGVFLTMCVLWTVWNCRSVDELASLASAARVATVESVLAIVAALGGLGLAAILFGRSVAQQAVKPSPSRAFGPAACWREGMVVIAGACVLLFMAVAPLLPGLGDTVASELLTSLRFHGLNERDLLGLTRGYYEELSVTDHDLDFHNATQAGSSFPVRHLFRPTHDFMLGEAIPGASIGWYGKTCSFNARGIRGPAYATAKSPGVFRIAIVGSSVEFGRGVGDDETLDRLLELRLNHEDVNDHIRRFEVWNFSLEAHGTLQKLLQVDKALAFKPDLIMYWTARIDAGRTADTLAQVLKRGYEIPAPLQTAIHSAVDKSQVDSSMSQADIENRLRPHMGELIREVFQQFADNCHVHAVRGCIVYRPDVMEMMRLPSARRRELLESARDSGLPVLDLSAAFRGVHDRDSLMIVPRKSPGFHANKGEGMDEHPNAQGHQLLADELYKMLHTVKGRELLKPVKKCSQGRDRRSWHHPRRPARRRSWPHDRHPSIGNADLPWRRADAEHS
jgi:hypothetical protein